MMSQPPTDDLDEPELDADDVLLFDNPPPDDFLDDLEDSTSGTGASDDTGQPDPSVQPLSRPSSFPPGTTTVMFAPTEYDFGAEPWYFSFLDGLGTVHLYGAVIIGAVGLFITLGQLSEVSGGGEDALPVLVPLLVWAGFSVSSLTVAGILKMSVNVGRDLRMIRMSVFGHAKNA